MGLAGPSMTMKFVMEASKIKTGTYKPDEIGPENPGKYFGTLKPGI